MKNFKLFEKCNRRIARRVTLIAVLLAMCIPQMWADDRQHYVGVALENPNNYTVKLNVNRATWGWYTYGTFKANLTYEGKKVYIANYQTKSDDNYIWDFQWQLYDGDTQKYSKNILTNKKSENYYDYYIYNYDGDAWYSKQVMNDSRTYFDATGWTGTDIRLVITHAQLQKYHTMYPVTGTKLYYTNDLSYWDNAMGVGVVSGGSSSRAGDQTAYYEYLTDISSQATEYTGLKHYSFNNNDEEKCYLIVNDGKAGEQPTITYEGTNYLTLLNKTQTINSVVREHDGYVSGNAKQQINISSYELTSQGSTTQRTPNMSTSESSETVSACRTATTTFSTSGAIASHYQFDGFWTGATSGSRLDNDVAGTYTYRPTAATTIYARYSRIRYTLTYNANGGTGSVPVASETIYSGESVTVKDNTGLLKKDGKVFAGWATTVDKANAGTIDYAPGATFTAAGNVDLYAVWTNGSYLINFTLSTSNGSKNTTDFFANQTLTDNSPQAVNGVTFSKSYYTTEGNQTSIKQQYSNPGRFIVYDTKSTSTTIRVYVKNTHTSTATVYYYTAKEGSTSETDQSETLNAGEAKMFSFDASNSKGTRVIICDNQYSKLYITQVIAIEKGSTLPLPGQANYELAFPGRVASHFLNINGIEVSGPQSNLKWNYDAELRLQSGSSKYLKFTTTAATQLNVKIQSGSGFYVCTDRNNPKTTGFLTSGSSAGTKTINLDAANTYYIMGENSSNTKIDKVSFAAHVDATAPTGFASTGTTSSSVDLSITDAKNSMWEIYYSTSSTAPTASTAATEDSITSKTPTVTGLSANTSYYMWVRSVADYFNKSSWVALTSNPVSTDALATFDLTVAVSPDGYGTVSPTSVTGITTGTSTSSSLNTFTVDGTTVTATAADATSAWTYAFDSWSGLPATVTEDATVTAVFTRTGKSYTITLDKQVASNTPTGSVSATYGSAMPSIATLPSHANYTFGGFYTAVAGGGTCYYDGEGASAKNSDFTATSTLYAKFTQDVTLHKNGGDNAGSATATYAGTVSSISAPEYSGHTVDGYYAESGCSNLVMTAAGVLQTSVTDGSSVVWTDASDKWKHAAASTLYAHWKCDAPAVTCTDNVVTMTVPSGATVYYTTDGSTTPTSSSTAYDPSNKPVIAANTTIKAIAIQDGCTSSSVTTQSCTYTAFSTSYNIEQYVLDNNISSTKFNALKTALTGAAISYDLSSGCSLDTLNDAPSDKGVYKVRRNEPYLGLKVKSSGKYIQINLKAGKTLKVKFGYIDATVDVTIDDVAQTGISSTSTGRVYELASSGSNRVVKLATSTDGAVVIKQIMIGEDEDIESVTLPAKITLGATTNGSISVDNTIVDVGSDVAITVTPSSGYELDELTVTRDTISSPSVSVTDNEFTMPNNNVTINATFVRSGYAITLGDHDNGSVAITDGSSAITSAAEGETVYLTATPDAGYRFTSWTVIGDDSSDAIEVTSNQFTMPDEAVTVSATFTAIDYRVNWHSANHAQYTIQVDEGEPTDGSVYANVGQTITFATTRVDAGYHLATWGVTETESGDEITVTDNQFTMPAANVNVRPIFGKYYTVTFDSNGGSTTPSAQTQTAVGQALTMPAAPTYADHTFVCWMIGGTTVTAGGSYAPPADVTAYAIWKEDCVGSTTITIGDFETSKHDKSNGKPDGRAKYLYGYTNPSSKTAANAVTMTISNGSSGAQNSGADFLVNYGSDVYVYADNTTTGGTPSSFEDITSISIKIKNYNSSNYSSFSILVGETTVANNVSLTSTENTYQTKTYNSLSNLDGIVKIVNHGSGSTNYNFYIDDIVITYGGSGGSCKYVTYKGNGAAGGHTDDATAYASSATVTVLSNSFSHPGYTFTGWNTKADGSGSSFAAASTFSITKDTTLYAQWSPATLTFTGASGADWTDPRNWTDANSVNPACVPTIDHDVIIQHTATLYGPYADDYKGHGMAKSVKIDKSVAGRNSVKLSIWSQASLIVAEDITAKHVDDADWGATTYHDLEIETSILGNGGLVCGSASSNTEVTYIFRTKAFMVTVNEGGKNKNYYRNQYFGIPFTTIDGDQYWGSILYKYDDNNDVWMAAPTDGEGKITLAPFTAYNLIRKVESGDEFTLKGTLNLPGTGAGKTRTLTCGWRAEDTGSTIDAIKTYQDFMFANSWSAPIDISSMTASDCSGEGGADLVHTIYIFNTGYEVGGVKQVGDEDGQWSAFPFKSSAYMEGAVIPATQAFLVTSKKGSTGATLTLDYKKHVYDPAVEAGQLNTFPTRAPRRGKAEYDAPVKLKMVVKTDSLILDKLYMFERPDFTNTFDNGWDGTKIEGVTTVPMIYAVQGNSKMAVSAVPELDGEEIVFRAGPKSNVYTFEFEYEEDAYPLYLYDRDTEEFTLIENKATYTFMTEDTEEHARFVLTRSKSPQIATGFIDAIPSNEEVDTSVRKLIQNDHVYILRGGHVYSVEGCLVK